MKHVKIAPCISLYEDVMSESAVIEFLAKVEEETLDEWSDLGWDYGKTGTGSTTDTRTSINCLLTSLLPPYEATELSDFYKKNIFLPCIAVAQDYRQEFMLEDCIPEEFAILKYYQGGIIVLIMTTGEIINVFSVLLHPLEKQKVGEN